MGPELSHLKDSGRLRLETATDIEALAACRWLSQTEGIIPALETSHAIAVLKTMSFKSDDIVVLNVSGRGDKDIGTLMENGL